jgi:hypothetical protein
LFSPVERAFAQAEPLFTLIQDKLQGKRVVFLANNHDHHPEARMAGHRSDDRHRR